MKILTTNHPIIVNGVKESKPSDYLSADGQALPDDYFSADGSDFYEARGRRRRWKKALNYIPAVAIANKLSNADGMTDVVSSKNPIIINGQDISNPTWYLSAEGSRMSKARASNIEKRLAKLNRVKANAQARIDKINTRVSESGKPMGRVDENIIKGLTKQITRVQAMIDKLVAMQSSSFNGDDYYGADGDDYYGADGDDYYGADGDDYYGADGDDYYGAVGGKISIARKNNVRKRIAKLQRLKANIEARISKINARVSASGKPMGNVDENIIRGLKNTLLRIQATLGRLFKMLSSSFDGDEYYNADGDDFYNIDQKNTADVKAFQTYANSKGAKLVVDGIWGAKTQAEWNKYGAEWEALKNPVSTAQVQNVVAQAPVVPQGQTPTATQVAEAKKKGLFWDKVKGGWVYAKESGLLDWVGNLFGLKPPPAFQPTPPTATTTITTTTTSDDSGKGMGKTTKTLLYVGGALALGFVIYTIAKPKK